MKHVQYRPHIIKPARYNFSNVFLLLIVKRVRMQFGFFQKARKRGRFRHVKNLYMDHSLRTRNETHPRCCNIFKEPILPQYARMTSSRRKTAPNQAASDSNPLPEDRQVALRKVKSYASCTPLAPDNERNKSITDDITYFVCKNNIAFITVSRSEF